MMSNKKKMGNGEKMAVTAAIESIGLGYDLAEDLKLKYCKRNSAEPRLIVIDDDHRDLVVPPGRLSIPNVPKSIKCDKGDRLRFASDVLSFQQMSELFNKEFSLSGKIPAGHFNTAFEFTGSWQKDAANTKSLAFDGVFITLYNIELEKSQVLLRDHVKQAVPSSWDPAALARFVEKYGTHIIVGVKMGGKDLIYAKQQYSSPLQPADVQKNLKDMADKMFADGNGQHGMNSIGRQKFIKESRIPFIDAVQSGSYYHNELQDVKFTCKRKGGTLSRGLSHNEWSQTVQLEPDVISMSFIPISSLLSGLHGSGFLSHAINLYLRYKPPIQELHQFLEFQLPRQWAPVFGDIPLGPDRKQHSASLQFSLMGPKLYVNKTPEMDAYEEGIYEIIILVMNPVADKPLLDSVLNVKVDVEKKPVTGLRLYLEGKRSNCLAIHLQHLSSQPKTFQLKDEPNYKVSHLSSDRRYYEKVQWKSFSHVCTAPVESDDDLSVVTGAHFEVSDSGLKKVLFLRLHFSKVIGAMSVKSEWDGSPGLAQKSGIISTLISTRFSNAQKQPPRPDEVNINSAVYPGGPPVPTQTPKLLRYVDTTEMTRGPQDSPGYWVVSGARLLVEKAKISLKVKYSLLTVTLPDEEVPEDY